MMIQGPGYKAFLARRTDLTTQPFSVIKASQTSLYADTRNYPINKYSVLQAGLPLPEMKLHFQP